MLIFPHPAEKHALSAILISLFLSVSNQVHADPEDHQDAGELDTLCDQVIAANPEKVAEIKGGNEKLLNWLTGQVMKAAPNKPNPKQVTDLLKGKLGL